MRLIDVDSLIKEVNENKELFEKERVYLEGLLLNAPTIIWCGETSDGLPLMDLRPQVECKTCKNYHPFCKQFSNEPRGDGYCTIARMTPEGMTTINCNDEFGCSDYQKGGKE